jgi:hypothetical protein
MAGLVPATYVFVSTGKVVDARAKPGHDTEGSQPHSERHCFVRAGRYPDAYGAKAGHDTGSNGRRQLGSESI